MMSITKKVEQPFLITSKDIIKLIKDGNALVYLPNRYGCYEEFKLVLNDEVEE